MGTWEKLVTRLATRDQPGPSARTVSGHPAIWSVAAVPVPDDYLGEKVCAAVVFRDQPVTLAELNRYLADRGVATHARLDMLVPIPALPTTPVGKVDKRALVAAISGG